MLHCVCVCTLCVNLLLVHGFICYYDLLYFQEKPYFYTNKNSNPTLFSTSQLTKDIQLDDNKSGSNHYGAGIIMIGSIIGSISCSVVVVIIVAIVIVRFKNKNRDPEKAVLLNKN